MKKRSLSNRRVALVAFQKFGPMTEKMLAKRIQWAGIASVEAIKLIGQLHEEGLIQGCSAPGYWTALATQCTDRRCENDSHDH